jgi:hypothetical protein
MAKLALCEFDAGQDWTRYDTGTWVNYSPGIFYTDFTGEYSDLASAWVEGAETLDVGSVGTMYITKDGASTRLTSFSSITALHAEPGFYWDEGDDYLYIRLPNYDPPGIYNITIGVSAYVAQRHWINEEGDSQYDGTLKSLPNIKRSIDPLFFGKISYDSATVVLDNTHGEYDDFSSYDVFGQEIRLFFGDTEDNYSDLTQVWTGYIDDFVISESDIEINASDPRRKLETPIPPNTYSTDDYANIDDRKENKPIALAYGYVKNVTPVCVNEGSYAKDTAGNFTFKLCDMTNHDEIGAITDVRYNGESLSGSVNTDDLYWNTGEDSLTDATLRIDKLADVELDFKKVTVDFSGVEDEDGNLISAGLDVIRDLIETYSGTAYVNANFDVTTWDNLAGDDKDIGLYIDKESTVLEAIEEITASIQMQFDVTGDGRYTARVFDDEKSYTRIIDEDEILGNISLSYNSDEFLSRVVVEYSGGKTYVYDDLEETVNKRFKYKRPKTFETLLTSSADADTFAQRVMELSKELKPIIELTTKTQTIGLNIEDLVIADINRRSTAWLGLSLCRVESVDIDLNSFEVTLGLRVLRDSSVDRGSSITVGERITTDDSTRVTTTGDTRSFYEIVEE